MAVTITIETGAGIAGANSYLPVADFKAYADQRGLSYAGKSDDQIGSALIRATAWLDGAYRSQWPGVRSYGMVQNLQWPRKAGSIINGVYVQTAYLATVTDAEGLAIAANAVPQMLKDALAEAAWRELNDPGSLAPDLERGGDIRRLRAGSVEVEYGTTASHRTTFSIIDSLLGGLFVVQDEDAVYTARAVRA